MNTDFTAPSQLLFDDQAKAHLAESARWGRFLSIVGFVFIALMALGALALMAFGSAIYGSISGGLGAMAGVGIGLLYLVVAAIYLYPTLKLYRFAQNARQALASGESHLLAESMRNLGGMFKFFGILTAIVIGIYALIFVFAMLAGLMGR